MHLYGKSTSYLDMIGISSFRGNGGGGIALSRDEVLIDLLRQDPRELHVEDFLWTGSGENLQSICIQHYQRQHNNKARRRQCPQV